MKHALMLAPSLLLLSLVACDRAANSQSVDVSSPQTSQPVAVKAAAKRVAKVIPWLEVNNCKPEEVDIAVTGLQIWQSITDEAIVSTIPGKSWLYRELKRRVPGMRIIPGMKTNTRLGERGFDSLAGWKLLAEDIAEVCRTSGEKRVVLENESALKYYWKGEFVIDTDRLGECLRQLPPEIQVYWYPVVIGKSAASKERGWGLIRTVEQACDVRFIDFRICSPADARLQRRQSDVKELTRIAANPPISMVYFGFKNRYWLTSQAKEVMDLVIGDDVIFYPGASSWIEVAREVSTVLRPPVKVAP